MRRHVTRAVTTVLVAGFCGSAVFHGWSIAAFAIVRAHGAAPDHTAVRSWVAVPGLAGLAREASLTPVADPTDLDRGRRRGDDLAAILSLWPLSSMNWLSLDGVRLATGEPYEGVLAALAMSSVTGPNEGAIMLQRGIFGLLQWEVLPADARQRIVADLAGAVLGMPIHDVEINRAKIVLSGKSADTRREIAGLLRAQGISPTELARMGL